MEPKVIRIEVKVTRTIVTVLAGLLLVALALLAVTSVGARPPLEGPDGQGEVTVASSVPTMISYQGQLLDSGGNLVPNGTYTMTFKLYDAPTGGTLLWSETQSVMVTDGLFNVLLGEFESFMTPEGEIYPFDLLTYLGVTVGGDPEMTPRQQMVSVPYAFVADTAKNGGGWTDDGTVVRLTTDTDNVGIGTDTPSEKLDVDGNIHASGSIKSGESINIYGTTNEIIATSPPDTYLRLVANRVSIGNPLIRPAQPQKLLDIVSRDYTDLGIRLSTELIGGTSWDIDNNEGVFKIVEHATCAPQFLDNPMIVVVGNCIGSPYGGNVAIGTITPTTKLHISNSNPGDPNTTLKLYDHALFSNADVDLTAHGAAILGDYEGLVINHNVWGAADLFTSGRVFAGVDGTGLIPGAGNRLIVKGAAAIGGNYYEYDAPTSGLIVEGNVGIGTTSPDANYKLHVQGGNRGIYGIATAGTSAFRPFGVVADVNTSAAVNTGGGFWTSINTSNTLSIPYVYGGQFWVNDGGGKNARALTLGLDNEKIDDFGLEILVDDPGYAIHSSGTGKVFLNGDVGIGTDNPQSTLQVEGNPGYLQIDSINVSPPVPPAAGCSVLAHIGRMILTYDSTTSYLCVCKPKPSLGWSCVAL